MWGSRTSTRERRQTQQVPLPPPPIFPRKLPDTLGRNDESLEGTNVSVDEDRRNQPRVLKVRRFLLACCVLLVADWWGRPWYGMIGRQRVTLFLNRRADLCTFGHSSPAHLPRAGHAFADMNEA